MKGLDETGAAAPSLDRQAAPEFKSTFDLKCLASVNRNEANPFAAHPLERWMASSDEEFDQVRISAILSDPAHIFEELIFAVSSKIGGAFFFFGKIGEKFEQIVKRVVCNPNRARRERGVPSALSN